MPKFFGQVGRKDQQQHNKEGKPRVWTAEELNFGNRLSEETVRDVRRLVEDRGKKRDRRVHGKKMRRAGWMGFELLGTKG
jgi:hypothetical protein